MHFGILTTLFTAFLLIIPAQAHERMGLKHHSKRFPKAEWAANSTNAKTRRQLFDNAKFTYYEAGLGACGKTSTDSDFVSTSKFSSSRGKKIEFCQRSSP